MSSPALLGLAHAGSEIEAFSALGAGELVMLMVATLLASVVSGLGGFGGGFVIAIAITPIVGAKGLLPLLAVFAFCSNISRVLVYRAHIDWPKALLFLASSSPGVAVGVAFYDWAPEQLLLGLLGGTLILLVPLRRHLQARGIRPGLAAVVGIGFAFGVLSGTSVGSGLFVIAALSGLGLSGATLLGTDSFIGLVNSAIRAFMFWKAGLLNSGLMLAGLLMGALTFPGTMLAKILLDRIGRRLHTAMIEMLIMAGGAYFMFSAVVAA